MIDVLSSKAWLLILIHQIIFQGMFFIKNIVLRKKLGMQIRGNNPEAILSIICFALFIGLSFFFSLLGQPWGYIEVVSLSASSIISVGLLVLNLLISFASLVHLRDSWRVGVIASQETSLITDGIYSLSRNPYFTSYLIMFIAYTLLLQNIILLLFTFINFLMIHSMIKKEEAYLHSVHGDAYNNYKNRVPRYLLK